MTSLVGHRAQEPTVRVVKFVKVNVSFCYRRNKCQGELLYIKKDKREEKDLRSLKTYWIVTGLYNVFI